MSREYSLNPVKSSYVDSFLYDRNFSDSKAQFIGFYKDTIKYRLFMQFDFCHIVKECVQVDRAILHLFCLKNDHVTEDCPFLAFKVLSHWDKTSISYINQPFYNSHEAVCSNSKNKLYDYIDFDITDFVKYWMDNPEKNEGLVIKAQNETSLESIIAINADSTEPVSLLTIYAAESTEKACCTGSNKAVAVLASQFCLPNGDRGLFGYEQRYLIDLVKLLQELGYWVDVFQPSSAGRWHRMYNDINIYGISTGEIYQDFFIKLNEAFYDNTQEYPFHIYFNMDLIYPHVFKNSICISHGIWWDSCERSWWRSNSWYNMLFSSLSAIDVLVSSDTNTINWLNAVKPDLKLKKLYIPNYVDTDIFKPDENVKDPDLIRILYSGRLCSSRGFGICKLLAAELTNEYENIIFSFTGKGSDQLEEYMKLLSSESTKTEYTPYDINERHMAYTNADIVLIPSLFSEGTSFPLLEAMACGKPVISGMVGGLTDLILQGFNGYLIEITKENLKNSILSLINNPDLRTSMGENARSVSLSFSKAVWAQRWTNLILDTFN